MLREQSKRVGGMAENVTLEKYAYLLFNTYLLSKCQVSNSVLSTGEYISEQIRQNSCSYGAYVPFSVNKWHVKAYVLLSVNKWNMKYFLTF